MTVVDTAPEARVFVAGESASDVEAVPAAAVTTTGTGVLNAVIAILNAAATQQGEVSAAEDAATPARRRWLIPAIAVAIAALAVTALAVALPRTTDRDDTAATPALAPATAPSTVTTLPVPRPAIVGDVDACTTLSTGTVPGHLVVTDLLASVNREGERNVGVITGESRPRDMTKLAPFTWVFVLGTAPNATRTEHLVDSAGQVQLWVRWNGAGIETALRRRSPNLGWVTEPVPDLRVEMNAGRILRLHWIGLVAGTPFATIASSGGACQSAGLDPATLQPVEGIATVK